MKKRIEELIEELAEMKERTAWQTNALSALKEARRQINYHTEAQVAKAQMKPKANGKAAASPAK